MSRGQIEHTSGGQGLVELLCISHSSLGNNKSPLNLSGLKQKGLLLILQVIAGRLCSKLYLLRNPAYQGLHCLERCQYPRQGEENAASHAVALEGFHSRVTDKSK